MKNCKECNEVKTALKRAINKIRKSRRYTSN